MPASNLDKFIKAVRKLAGTIDSSGIINGTVDNFGLSSGSGLPTDTAVEIIVDRADSNGTLTPDKEEVIRGVVDGDRIVDAARGVAGTAQAHPAGSVWEVMLTADQWNRMIDGILAEHNQDGSHSPNASNPIGMVVDFAGSSAPTGWLICDGEAVSQETYAALFAVIGHTYGADPGGGNFLLPDAKGKATVGYKSGDSNFGALGNVAAGEKTHLLTGAESGTSVHSHKEKVTGSQGGGTNPRFSYIANDGPSVLVTDNAVAANAASPHNNIQPSIVFNKIIKY